MHNDQLNSVVTDCGLSLNLYKQRLRRKILIETSSLSSIQFNLLWSFIAPAVDLSSGGTGRDQKDFYTWENITVGIIFGLWHYMKHMAHLQNLSQLGVT